MKRISLYLISFVMCCSLTMVYARADDTLPNDTAGIDNNALVELYYAELIKQADKSLLNEASDESSKLAVYYSELAKQDMNKSNVYLQLAEYYKAVANTNCICMINGTYAATGVCTCGKNSSLNVKSNIGSSSQKSNSKKASEPFSWYKYDSYGYLVDGSMFVVKGKLLVKDGKYFIDKDGLHYAIDEDDIVYGIDKIEKETGKAYRIEAVETSQSKHSRALKDKNNFNLWVQLSNS